MQNARFLFWIAASSVIFSCCTSAATSDWLSAPKPRFPTDALKKGSEGSVTLQVVLTKDGRVAGTTILRSSRDGDLDAAAQQAVLHWRMKPSAIKPSDLTKGRKTIIEFKQEALLAAVYPDRQAFFHNWKFADIWMFAPFPAYTLSARQQYHTGEVLLRVRIGGDGQVDSVQVTQSSGHGDLDELAVKAVRLWRAHKQFSGNQYTIPIDFNINGRHY
jgi:TonB family protein